MASALEKRIRKLEQTAGGLPRKKPGHESLRFFVTVPESGELRPEDAALLKSICECKRCKEKQAVKIIQFGQEPEEKPIEAGLGFDIHFQEWGN